MDGPSEYVGNGLPQSYEFPQTFVIGQKRTKSPLVTSVQLKNHLALLRAFIHLRAKVDQLNVATNSLEALLANRDRRWVWFVGLAVDRFSLWCDSLTKFGLRDSDEDCLPPLDVLMVWHAYLLNPLWYAEDTLRVSSLRPLAKSTPMLARLLSSNPESFLLATEPTNARLESWRSRTGKPFDPFEDARHTRGRQIFCPKCRIPIQAPYMNSSGSGYLQAAFRVSCPSSVCKYSPSITKASLAARKLAEDLVRTSKTDLLSPCLAGTIRTAQVPADHVRGKIIKEAILSDATFKPSTNNEQWTISILAKTSYDLKRLQAVVTKNVQAKGVQLGKRIISAYENGDRFSIDLVGAVIRQGSFIRKMHGLDWTAPEFFASAEKEVTLEHAIARYHAFLDLMSASPASFHVPTLDVDLAWHTHQLMGDIYNEDCMSYVRRYVDHNDNVEEGKLASAFDSTCRAWKNRFGIAYTHRTANETADLRTTAEERREADQRSYDYNPVFLIPVPHYGRHRAVACSSSGMVVQANTSHSAAEVFSPGEGTTGGAGRTSGDVGGSNGGSGCWDYGSDGCGGCGDGGGDGDGDGCGGCGDCGGGGCGGCGG